jgi:WD40 repeat protein
VALYTEKFNLSLVDLEADKILREIPKPKLDDWAPQFTPDGKRLALYGGDYDPEWLRTRTVPRPGRGEIREFDVESGKEIRSYLGQDGPINRMAYSQDGTLMASVGWTTVRIWDAKAGKQLHSFTRVGPSWLQSTGCAFSPDNKFLACAEGSLLVVWNTTTGQKVFETDKGGCNFAFSHDGKIAWSHDGLHVQDITASKKVLTVKCAVAFRNLGFSPNGRMVALGTEAGLVIVPIPKTALDPAPNLAIGPDLSIGSDRLTAKKLEAIPGARKLVARVKTTSDDNVDKTFTKHLQNLSVSATKTQLVVDFDVDRKKWEPVTRSMSLVVRLLDKDGKYLTHFVTKESVTAQPAVFDGWIAMQNRIPPEVRDKLLPDFTPVLLEPQSNRFIYGVDPAVLRDAAIVEVGFLYVKKGPL